MLKRITTQLLLFTIVSTTAIHIAYAGNKDTGNPRLTKTGNRTSIDISIHQPNVEDCYEVSIYDMEIDQNWIHIYPNPNPGQFTLEAKLPQYSKSLHIQIYDITGKLVFRSRETIEGHQFSKELNVSFLEKGVYFIRITGEHRVGVKQIIIN